MKISHRTLRRLGGLTAAALPVAYVVKSHVGWEQSTQGKKRMLTHQLTFWSSFVAAVMMAHKTRPRQSLWAKILLFSLSGILPLAGFEGGGMLATRLFPNIPPSPPGRLRQDTYVPSYLLQ